VAAQPEIEKVRILSKSGIVMHSSQSDEIGHQIDQEAEACLACHLDEKSRLESPLIGRSRFFNSPDGRRMLGATAVIHNEPTCVGSGCHGNQVEQPVLGVLDIVTPLEEIEHTLRSNTYTVFGLSLGFILLAGFLVSFLVRRVIPVRSKDEFGQLAASFNSMTDALRASHVDLENWGHTLEQKVKEARRELEIAHTETARSEKLASVGLLAAGIAHELNNPLTGVLTFAYLVRKNLPDDSRDAEDLDLVISETKRCAGIIRRLLDFSREKTPEKAYGDLNAIIRDAVQLIEQPAQLENIEIITDLDEDLPLIWLDENLIKQVMMNMLVNARHAISDGGTVTIKTRECDASNCPKPVTTTGRMVEITITDTGCGISPDDLKKIFDPFFTTKGVGRGTGLGLSVSHGTIVAHRGAIDVESELGKGTSFHIYLAIARSDDQGFEA
jgi:two-component system NtrC family sensor kinase